MIPEAPKAEPVPGWLRYPHLVAALAAIVIVLAGSLMVLLPARARVRSDIAVLGPKLFDEKWRGIAVQREAFRHDALLPMYGSSELIGPMGNRVTEFFASAPTGFSVVPIGDRGSPPLSFLLRLGSLGEAIRGRRMVISVSGTWFELGEDKQDRRGAFAANYSALQAGDLMFRTTLPEALKQRIARRLVAFSGAIGDDALLRLALFCVAKDCAYRPLLRALRPLWFLRSFPFRVQDYALSAGEVDAGGAGAQRIPPHPNWAALEARADTSWRLLSSTNRFGINNGVWGRWSTVLLAEEGKGNDSTFLGAVASSPSWEDLDILLATLDALGARPLLLNTPLKGPFLDFTGVSQAARGRFYDRFLAQTARYRFPTRDFREYDNDPNFLSEPGSHLSMKGWLVYDRAIDAFYHDSIR